MEFKDIIEQLLDSGKTEREIAEMFTTDLNEVHQKRDAVRRTRAVSKIIEGVGEYFGGEIQKSLNKADLTRCEQELEKLKHSIENLL